MYSGIILLRRVHQDCESGRPTSPIWGAERFANLSMPVPPLPVQRKIVAKLDALLAQSRAAREQLAASRRSSRSTGSRCSRHAFLGDLTADWRKNTPTWSPHRSCSSGIRVDGGAVGREMSWRGCGQKGKVPKDDKWLERYEAPAPVDIPGLPELPDGCAGQASANSWQILLRSQVCRGRLRR